MHSISSQSVGQGQVQPPPFYWKVPSPEKDYMSENVRRIRAASSQQKKSKREPMKATFIPGVTRNPRYDHIPSRLVGFIHNKNVQDEGCSNGSVPLRKTQSHTGISASKSTVKFLPDKFNPSLNGNLQRIESHSQFDKSSKPIWGASEAANSRRLSRSTTDLAPKAKPAESLSTDSHVPSRRKRSEPLKPQEESVYNWRFTNTNNVPHNNHAGMENNPRLMDAQNLHYHRVDLPCDGICAEENIIVNGNANPDSGRSSTSSCRTSRGVNTDETRIYHSVHANLQAEQSLDRIEDESGYHEAASKQRNFHTLKNNTDVIDKYQSKPQLQAYSVNGKTDAQINRIRNEMSSLKVKDNSTTSSNVGPAGDMPHSLGTVPKYLKQRQQEWKYEAEARKEAENNKDIPPGHILMPDHERLETLNTLKKNYDSLVLELNSIPIRMDTIRVRDQKIKLEHQFEKLEQAMRVFSRPRVFVKMDQ